MAGGEVLAQQTGADTSSLRLVWRHTNPITGDLRETDSLGRVVREMHRDPGGADVGTADPFEAGDSGGSDLSIDASQAAIDRLLATVIAGYGRGLRCKVDGFVMGCRFAFRVAASGAGVMVRGDAPSGKFIKFINLANGQSTYRWSPLTAAGNWVGYLPMGASLGVDGRSNLFTLNLKEIAKSDSPFHGPSGVFSLNELAGFVMHSMVQNAADRRLTADEFAPIREAFQNMLTAKCKEFIDKLVSFNTGTPYDSGKNLLNHLDDTFKFPQAGVFYGRGETRGRQNFGDIEGVNIGEWNSMRFYRPDQILRQTQIYASTLLHEIVHTLTHGADDRLTEDVLNLRIVPQDDTGKPLPPPKTRGFNSDYHSYWSTALKNACFPNLR